ncbi:CdaR family protein [Oceanispirochaeta sp.]|jgi:YbbR domain-containing protein|uniref:CdaR family protein n=1 Tax=Oceanispirochaeta sp. TaxID=2035350 RepID=UPI002614F2F9|nr:CdaR family protein [Oceanispirochaeta sp.]MDA3955673.1 CdaR family protein [Oceanispirochaeta sp.]
MKKGLNQILFDRWLAKILSILAAILLSLFYQINNLEERFFSIPLEILTTEGLSVTGNFPVSVRVNLRGTEELIYSILDNEISAVADFRTFEEEGTFKVPVEISLLSSYGHNDETMEIEVEPREVTISQEEKVIRSLEIQPVLTAFVPNGYELVQYFVSPTYVTVQGPRSQLESITGIKTEEIDLSGRYDDFTVSSRLIPPGDNVSFPGGNTVELRGAVEEAVIIQNLTNLEIVSVDLDLGFIISENLPEMAITLQGSQLMLEQLRARDLHFYIDCSRIIVPGTYTLPVQVDTPEGVVVLKYSPREIQVSFSERGETQ